MAALDVVIVGAGIAGLTCAISLARYTGINVTVVEKSTTMEPIGNGIQIPCNAAHVLRTLGLLDKLIARAGGIATETLSVDYKDGRVLLKRDFSNFSELYGAPWLLVHRSDYIDVLYEEVCKLPIDVKLNHAVASVDLANTSIAFVNGEVHRADVIVGCDGISSTIRAALYPTSKPANDGTFVYRTLISAHQLPSSLKYFSTSSTSRMWLGPGAHAVLYSIRSGNLINLVMSVADLDFNLQAKQHPNPLSLVRQRLHDWDPVFLELLDAADDLVMFPLCELPMTPSWRSGNVVLMGDAAHACLPHLGQGAAMAVEDALVFATLFGKLVSHHSSSASPGHIRGHISRILDTYIGIQRPRTTHVADNSRKAGWYNLLPPGPEQKARDEEFAVFNAETCISKLPWIDAAFNSDLLARDTAKVAEREFERLTREEGWASLDDR